VLATRGAAGEDCLRAFFAAGYDAGQALDVVLAIGASTLSTYANRLTGVPLDGAFAPFRWEAPRAGAI
jgi:alkylhydroperoxidase family enzyme